MSYTLSDLINYVKDGEVPYPIFAALNVKRPKLAREFHGKITNNPVSTPITQRRSLLGMINVTSSYFW